MPTLHLPTTGGVSYEAISPDTDICLKRLTFNKWVAVQWQTIVQDMIQGTGLS